MMDPEKVSKLQITGRERTASSRRGIRRSVSLLVVATGVGGLVYWLIASGALVSAVAVQAVSATRVYPSQVVTEFNASGYVVAQRKAAVSSKGTGRLAFLGVKEGSRVKAGDVLARLENDDLEAERSQIEGQLAAARAELSRADADSKTALRQHRRLEALWRERVVAKAEYENARDQDRRAGAVVAAAKANIRALEAGLKRASVLLDYTEIRAPFDGVVLTKNADEGEVVAPFGSAVNARAAVVTMADLSSLEVQTDVSEAFLHKVREGQPAEIQLDALPDARLSGKAATIVPTADRTRGTVMVKVQFDRIDPRILPEMSARVAFLSRPLEESEKLPFLAVHADALTERGGAKGVFVLEGDRVRWVPLMSAVTRGDFIALDPPWKEGDKVVKKPSVELRDGARVEIAE
ncbi:MAG: efflux RND transporter periplasmic adaptor subunit [Syntrophobacteraceae bacterium]